MLIKAVDCETTGVDLHHDATPFLVTMFYNGQNKYWEWQVDPRTRKPRIPVEDLEEIQAEIDEADLIVGQNFKFDRTALNKINVYVPWNKVRDTLPAGHLLASNQPHDLTSMGIVYLGVNISEFEEKVVDAVNECRRYVRSEFPGWLIAKEGVEGMPSAKGSVAKFDMWLLRMYAAEKGFPEDHPWWTLCSDYANADSALTLPLWQEMEKRIRAKGLWEIYEERQKVYPVIYQMESNGITYSGSRLSTTKKKFQEESDEHAQICRDVAEAYGYDLELPKSGNNKSLTKFIFDVLKMPPMERSKKTGEPSLNKTVMDHYRLTCEGDKLWFIEALMAKRKRDTAVSYLEGYERYGIRGEETPEDIYWRLFSSVNPTGSDTLRMSSSNPNQQNIEKQEDEEKQESFNIRYAFGPAPGREWYSIDYENLELKIPAYESGERLMIDVFEKPNEGPFWGSYHLLNASIIYPDLFWPIADKKGEFKNRYKATWYQWVKNFGFAVQYGAQEFTADKAAHKAGAYKAVKEQMIEIEKLNQACIRHANKFGYVETIPDKEINPQRGYPLLCRRSAFGSISPTLPLNYRVQGTACWIMMRAMIKVQEYLDTLDDYRIIMNVHDELVFDFPKKAPLFNRPIIRRVQRIMESMGECVGVPLTCGVTHHPDNWSKGLAI